MTRVIRGKGVTIFSWSGGKKSRGVLGRKGFLRQETPPNIGL